MSRVIVSSFGLSIDGFGAGPDQSIDNPLGVGGTGFVRINIATPRALLKDGLERIEKALG